MRVNADADVSHHGLNDVKIIRAERFAAGLAAQGHQTSEFPTHDHGNNQFDVLSVHFLNMVEEKLIPRVFGKLAFFVNFKSAFAGIQKAVLRFRVNDQLDFVVFAEAPGRQTVCPVKVRRTFEYGAAANCERAEEQVQRRADHLDEVAGISDLLAEVGKRAEGVDKLLCVCFHREKLAG